MQKWGLGLLFFNYLPLCMSYNWLLPNRLWFIETNYAKFISHVVLFNWFMSSTLNSRYVPYVSGTSIVALHVWATILRSSPFKWLNWTEMFDWNVYIFTYTKTSVTCDLRWLSHLYTHLHINGNHRCKYKEITLNNEVHLYFYFWGALYIDKKDIGWSSVLTPLRCWSRAKLCRYSAS